MNLKKQSSFLIAFFFIFCSCKVFESIVPSGTPIELPESMVDTEGNEITTVRIKEGSAAILRYQNQRKIAAQNLSKTDVPRPGKSIRLGGYFFGGWGSNRLLSTSQQDWIVNNLDVLVL